MAIPNPHNDSQTPAAVCSCGHLVSEHNTDRFGCRHREEDDTCPCLLPRSEAALAADNAALRQALEFYADAGNYCWDDELNHLAEAYQGGKIGNIAREALKVRS